VANRRPPPAGDAAGHADFRWQLLRNGCFARHSMPGMGAAWPSAKPFDLEVPSHRRWLLEGHDHPGERELPDGPFGRHRGFYGGVELHLLGACQLRHPRRNRWFSPPSAAGPPKERRLAAIALEPIYTPSCASRSRRSSISS